MGDQASREPATESGRTFAFGSLAEGRARWGRDYSNADVVVAIEDEAGGAAAREAARLRALVEEGLEFDKLLDLDGHTGGLACEGHGWQQKARAALDAR